MIAEVPMSPFRVQMHAVPEHIGIWTFWALNVGSVVQTTHYQGLPNRCLQST